MSTHAYAVRVYQHPSIPGVWTWDCHCGDYTGWLFGLPRAHDDAALHAATCQPLHWANWRAAATAASHPPAPSASDAATSSRERP